MDFLLRENIWCSTERSQGSFVEARQNQFFLAWVSIDITNRENARNVGLEFFSVHDFQLFALDFQAPLGDWAELW